MGEGIKTYQDGTAKRGKWEGGVFVVTGDVEEGENRNLHEAGKQIDISKVMPDGLPPKITDQPKIEESKV